MKQRLYLVLSRHGAFDPKTHRTACPGNDFFKRKVCGLIDEEVIHGGKKAAILKRAIEQGMELFEASDFARDIVLQENPATAAKLGFIR